MDANSVLIDALTTYSLNLGDYKVNITVTNNAISKCKDYLSHNAVTTDWVKRNWAIMSPAVKAHRKYLVDDIHHARIIEDKEALEKLQAEYDILAPYIDLFKKFPDFIQ